MGQTACRVWIEDDADNTRAAAAIVAGATWNGVTHACAGFQSVWITITAAQAGTLTIYTGQLADGTDEAAFEAWPVPIGTAAARFPVPLIGANYYRLDFVDAGVGGNLQIDAELDPRAIDHDISPWPAQNAAAVANGVTTAWAKPLGARYWTVSARVTANPVSQALGVYPYSNNLVAGGAAWLASATADGHSQRMVLEPGYNAATYNGSGGNVDIHVWFYP